VEVLGFFAMNQASVTKAGEFLKIKVVFDLAFRRLLRGIGHWRPGSLD